jgi:hypothetical protein
MFRSWSSPFAVVPVVPVGHGVEVTFKSVQPIGPQPAVGPQPLVDFGERLRPQLVPPPLGVMTHPHKARLAEHAQMLRRAGLAQPELFDQLADRPGPLEEQIQDAPARGLGEDMKRSCHISYITMLEY